MILVIQGFVHEKHAKYAANFQVVSSAGVYLHGTAGAHKSWLENTNNYPVVIKQIHQSLGDRTLAIFVLESGEKKYVNIEFNDGFIIIQVTNYAGLEVGFISANSPRE